MSISFLISRLRRKKNYCLTHSISMRVFYSLIYYTLFDWRQMREDVSQISIPSPAHCWDEEKGEAMTRREKYQCEQGEDSYSPIEPKPRKRGKKKVNHFPAKVYENCQRTARIILLNELDQKLGKQKKLRCYFNKILLSYLPQKGDSEDFDEDEKRNTKYFKSVNYSRVRMGHKSFQQKILYEPKFYQFLQQILDSEDIFNSAKPRKNQRSKMSFQDRKQVIEEVLSKYKRNFLAQKVEIPIMSATDENIKMEPELSEEEGEGSMKEIEKTFLQQKQILSQESQNRYLTPLLPIPLKPLDYQIYMMMRIQAN